MSFEFPLPECNLLSIREPEADQYIPDDALSISATRKMFEMKLDLLLESHKKRITKIIDDPINSAIFTVGQDNRICKWSLTDRNLIYRLGFGKNHKFIIVSEKANSVYSYKTGVVYSISNKECITSDLSAINNADV